MSRHRVHEVSSPISLFPFIGILLCTMGALLVVLVAVSRSARDSAVREVEGRKQAATAPNDGVRQKITQVRQYCAELDTARGKAERGLREQQSRLSHVEGHIRRLHDQFRSLEIAATELDALEKEHYDDRKQAEREVERLHQLIRQSKDTIASMRDEAAKGAHSYAVVPYEGPNGTFRRPLYVECRKDELLLQPEGVRVTRDQLRQPIGPGNPLAAALRAARDHYVRLYPGEGQSRDVEPYPLLLVRPEGLIMFEKARRAIEAGDFDFGFELVESDWDLKYPEPDVVLAGVEQVAIEQAVARQEVMAAAAPRAYRTSSFAISDELEFGGDGGGGGGGPYSVGGRGGTASEDFGGDYIDDESYGDAGGNGGSGSGSGGGGNAAAGGLAHGGSGRGGSGNNGSGGAGARSGQGFAASVQGSGGEAGSLGAGNPNAVGGTGGPLASGSDVPSQGGAPPGDGKNMDLTADPNLRPQGMNASNGGSGETSLAGGSHRAEQRFPQQSAGTSLAESRGKDWALRGKPPRSVPIRRTIRVVVRDNQLAILPEGTTIATEKPTGEVIPMPGDTIEALDPFVTHVRKHVEGWGIAGDGLYWRPVLVLSVAPDGQRRANDLARLLKNSGLELNMGNVAQKPPQGGPNETR